MTKSCKAGALNSVALPVACRNGPQQAGVRLHRSFEQRRIHELN